MDLFSMCYSDPFPNPTTPDFPDSSSTSDNLTNAANNYSDDEQLLLASNNPKKRAGRKKFRETRHPVFRGARRRNSGKWVCEVREPNKKSRIWLGTFPTAEMAARAHDVAAIALRGRSACLNFADSAWRLPVPVSPEPKHIQKAAAEAAEAFRPSEYYSCDGASSSSSPEMAVSSDDINANKSGEVSCGSMELMPENVSSSSCFMDEEAVFGMPALIANMAEGLMLPPPQSQCGYWDDLQLGEANADDMFLWSYSI